MKTAELLERVAGEGGTITLEGDSLRLVAARPLPADVVMLLQEHKADIVEAIRIREFDSTFPHRRAIGGSLTRPRDFDKLDEEQRDIWKAVVYGAMVNVGRDREEAEGVAWATLFPNESVA